MATALEIQNIGSVHLRVIKSAAQQALCVVDGVLVAALELHMDHSCRHAVEVEGHGVSFAVRAVASPDMRSWVYTAGTVFLSSQLGRGAFPLKTGQHESFVLDLHVAVWHLQQPLTSVFAAVPTTRRLRVKATTDGIVHLPSAILMMCGLPSWSRYAMQLQTRCKLSPVRGVQRPADGMPAALDVRLASGAGVTP